MIEKGDRMAGFFIRKNQRFKESVPVQYRGRSIVGEGIIKDLSLSGGHIKGKTPVSEGMVLELHVMLPGESQPLLIDRATVQWVRGLEFGVELKPPPQVAERLAKLVALLTKTLHGSLPSG